MAALPPEGEEASEPLKYKTWVLKVSIHCEGCKRKVKRILHSVEGVYTIDVETKQHKVIVTGNVEANTLLRKLEKSGKHAELWPDFNRRNNPNRNLNHSEQQQPNQDGQPQSQNPNVDQAEKVAVNVVGQPPNGNDNNNPGQQQQQQQQHAVREVRFEGNIPAAGECQTQPGNDGSGGAGGGAKKKRKKKKGHGGNSASNGESNNNNGNGNNNSAVNNEVSEQQQQQVQQQVGNCGPPCSELPPQGMGPPSQYPNPSPVSMSPPRHHMPNINNRVYEYPPAYCAPPPVYGVSYNTAYPRAYAASYYSAPTPYSYAYVHQGGDVEHSMPSDWNPNSVHPADTFEIFSDENPNACSVM